MKIKVLGRLVSVYSTCICACSTGGQAAARLGTPSMTKRYTVASNLDWTTGSSDRRRPMVDRLIGAHSHTKNRGRNCDCSQTRDGTEDVASFLTRVSDDARVSLSLGETGNSWKFSIVDIIAVSTRSIFVIKMKFLL